MTRSEARELAMRITFAYSMTAYPMSEVIEAILDKEYYETLKEEDALFEAYPEKKQISYIQRVAGGIYDHDAELDGYVEKYSSGWKFHRISRTALAIMKVAMYEIMYMSDIPDKVSINEAVELAKKYDEPETVPYVNGILGAFFAEEISKIRE